MLVDGGYVNNCPTDVMRAMGARIIVAVDVSGHGLPESRMKPWGDALSGWTLIAKSWLPQWLGGGPSCPTMAAMQSHLPYITDYANAARRWRTVDVMVRPVVANIPILAFNRYAEVVRAGHEAGLRAIRAWKVANPDALPILDDGMWRPSNLAGGAGGGGFGGVTLREVGSKGRLVGAIEPGAGGGIGARLPSTETLVRGSGLLGASSSSYGGGMDRSGGMGGGNSSGDLLARGVDSEMVEAMERDPFGRRRARRVAHGARIADPNPSSFVRRTITWSGKGGCDCSETRTLVVWRRDGWRRRRRVAPPRSTGAATTAAPRSGGTATPFTTTNPTARARMARAKNDRRTRTRATRVGGARSSG